MSSCAIIETLTSTGYNRFTQADTCITRQTQELDEREVARTRCNNYMYRALEAPFFIKVNNFSCLKLETEG